MEIGDTRTTAFCKNFSFSMKHLCAEAPDIPRCNCNGHMRVTPIVCVLHNTHSTYSSMAPAQQYSYTRTAVTSTTTRIIHSSLFLCSLIAQGQIIQTA